MVLSLGGMQCGTAAQLTFVCPRRNEAGPTSTHLIKKLIIIKNHNIYAVIFVKGQ